jgi:hypothetical protein
MFSRYLEVRVPSAKAPLTSGHDMRHKAGGTPTMGVSYELGKIWGRADPSAAGKGHCRGCPLHLRRSGPHESCPHGSDR